MHWRATATGFCCFLFASKQSREKAPFVTFFDIISFGRPQVVNRSCHQHTASPPAIDRWKPFNSDRIRLTRRPSHSRYRPSLSPLLLDVGGRGYPISTPPTTSRFSRRPHLYRPFRHDRPARPNPIHLPQPLQVSPLPSIQTDDLVDCMLGSRRDCTMVEE